MDYKEFDSLVNVALINFYTLSKDGSQILLDGIDVNDKRHLACVHIASLAKDVFGIQFYLPSGRLNYWKVSRKCKSKKWLERINRKNIKSINALKPINVEDFISHIEKANNKENIFSEIYDEYFKEKKK